MRHFFSDRPDDHGLCSDCPTTSKSGSRGAGVAMFTDHNRQAISGESCHLRDMNFIPAKILLRGNIEITVVKVTLPIYGNSIATHYRRDRAGIELGCQFHKIIIHLIGCLQPITKTSERNVTEVIKVIESNSPFFLQDVLISFCGLLLCGRQKSSDRIGNQIKFETGSFYSVADGVELL
jgi:hypothetical protein